MPWFLGRAARPSVTGWKGICASYCSCLNNSLLVYTRNFFWESMVGVRVHHLRVHHSRTSSACSALSRERHLALDNKPTGLVAFAPLDNRLCCTAEITPGYSLTALWTLTALHARNHQICRDLFTCVCTSYTNCVCTNYMSVLYCNGYKHCQKGLFYCECVC